MRLSQLSATIFVAALSLSVHAQQKPASADTKAIRDMAEANMAEVEAGKLAAQKAQSAEVKKFAQHMVDDHGKMLQEVQQLAQSKGVDLPKSPNAAQQAAMKKLESTSSDKFDSAYMQQMVKDHRATAEKVQGISRNSKDKDIKAAAEKALPDIKEHLQMAQSLAGKSAAQGGSSAKSKQSESGSKGKAASGSSSKTQ